jgi:hypothetical protein
VPVVPSAATVAARLWSAEVVSIGYMDGTADYPTRYKYGFTIATSTNCGG